MDHTDRIRRLRHTSRLRRGRLDRRTGARLRPLLALAALLLVLVPGTPAWAHNALAEADPAKNATLKKSPSEVRLRFLQKLNPEYTTVTVSDAGKATVSTSAPKVNGATAVVTVGTLDNGVYTVAYQVVSTDGHTVKGSYEFTVDDPSASAAPSAAPSPATPVTSAAAVTSAASPPLRPASSNSTLYGFIAGVVAVLAAAAVLLFIRRRKA
ncbi:copper resistance CopC family protein [Actinoplanes sp. NPDC049802]|uniref:copper resistance CopC family protein n=1 Tax=Actinoplanes sp. NPDC049802 TaxID=3154742 RepID=UPI0034093CCB